MRLGHLAIDRLERAGGRREGVGGRGVGGGEGGERCRERKRWKAGSVLKGRERALVNQTETGPVSSGAAMGKLTRDRQFRFWCSSGLGAVPVWVRF